VERQKGLYHHYCFFVVVLLLFFDLLFGNNRMAGVTIITIFWGVLSLLFLGLFFGVSERCVTVFWGVVCDEYCV